MSSATSQDSKYGLPAIPLIVFIVLKLTHVIAWPWWAVLSPLWAGPLVFLAVAVPILVVVNWLNTPVHLDPDQLDNHYRFQFKMSGIDWNWLEKTPPGSEGIIPKTNVRYLHSMPSAYDRDEYIKVYDGIDLWMEFRGKNTRKKSEWGYLSRHENYDVSSGKEHSQLGTIGCRYEC